VRVLIALVRLENSAEGRVSKENMGLKRESVEEFVRGVENIEDR
jgi:hypothetical protein